MNDRNEIIEIRDSEIDAEAIMRQIRENIRKRRAQAEAQGLDYDAFLHKLSTSRITVRFDESLYRDLQKMSSEHAAIGVGLSLTEPLIPFIAPLVQRVRAAIHGLVLYYVNMLADQQRRFNEHVANALVVLVKGLEKDPTRGEVEELRQEIAQLRAQVEQLEAGIGCTDE